MRIVIQRVHRSSVEVKREVVGSIDKGLLVLIGVTHNDEEEDGVWLSKKLSNMRLFRDEDDKMNLSVKDIKGEVLVVSQFTLFASTKKGTRPSFMNAALPEKARELYEFFAQSIENELGKPVQCGVFGADMNLTIENDGPVTIVLDSKKRE
ncbi:MAG: D-tyrosyl-tRNA(Tyr) deacylase [Saprospiraceae bacterium]|jgi:D-tyrosyl-tRNA(Tyr) deacylase